MSHTRCRSFFIAIRLTFRYLTMILSLRQVCYFGDTPTAKEVGFCGRCAHFWTTYRTRLEKPQQVKNPQIEAEGWCLQGHRPFFVYIVLSIAAGICYICGKEFDL